MWLCEVQAIPCMLSLLTATFNGRALAAPAQRLDCSVLGPSILAKEPAYAGSFPASACNTDLLISKSSSARQHHWLQCLQRQDTSSAYKRTQHAAAAAGVALL